MIPETENIPESRLQSLSKLLILIAFFFLGQVVGGILAFAVIIPVFGLKIADLASVINSSSTHPQLFNILMILQGIVSICTFIGGSLFFLGKIEKQPLITLNSNQEFKILPAIIALMVVITSAGLSGYLMQMTQLIDFQKWGTIGKWIVSTEDNAKQLTNILTQFNHTGTFITGLIVIAIIPAIGEEMLFRGLMQPKINNIFKNLHVAVWLTAFIFSFIHFQFYGFLSRMMLGVLFGYMYIWSGNIVYPMIAHFTNNGAQVLLLYLYQQKIVTFNIDDDTTIPVGIAIVSLLITILLLYLFKNLVNKQNLSFTQLFKS